MGRHKKISRNQWALSCINIRLDQKQRFDKLFKKSKLVYASELFEKMLSTIEREIESEKR
jgi:hypothetical protein